MTKQEQGQSLVKEWLAAIARGEDPLATVARLAPEAVTLFLAGREEKSVHGRARFVASMATELCAHRALSDRFASKQEAAAEYVALANAIVLESERLHGLDGSDALGSN